MKCVYNPLAQLFTIMLLTEDACPYRGTLNCIKIRATNEMPNYFNGGRQAPALRRNCIAFLATKKDGYAIRPFKRPPEIPRVARPFGVRLGSYRAMARYEVSLRMTRAISRPRSRALRAPAGFDSVPPVSF